MAEVTYLSYGMEVTTYMEMYEPMAVYKPTNNSDNRLLASYLVG